MYSEGNRLYIPISGNLRRHIMRESHDSPWVGHPERERMIALVKRRYVWPHLDDYCEAYVMTCLIFQQDKMERRKEAGLL